MSKKAIKTLNDKFPNYNLQVEVAGQNKAQKSLAKAIVQIFDPKYEAGKQPTVIKVVTCWGIGDDEMSAQENAIDTAVKNLGL